MNPFKQKPVTRLHDLKIREVSSVDRGAGEDVKVAFWKRDVELGKSDDDGVGATSFEEELYKITGNLDPVGTVTKEADDDAILTRVSINDDAVTKEDPPLYTFDPDITAVAKRMAAEGRPSCLYKRADFLEELHKRAQAERRGTETREQAFTRLATSDPDGIALFKAHRASPGHDPDLTPIAEPVARTSASLDRLRELAEELHKSEPSLTREQSFAKVYADPANRALAARERAENRPGMEVEKRGGAAPVADRVHALAASLARAHPDLSHADAIKVVLERNPALAAACRQEQVEQADRKD
jgi:hypothetical protein